MKRAISQDARRLYSSHNNNARSLLFSPRVRASNIRTARLPTSGPSTRANSLFASQIFKSTQSLSSIRRFATATADAAKKNAKEGAKKTKKADDSNVFFDNLGKIFLATIASIVIALIRSSYNTSNRNDVRDFLEDIAAIDPYEIDELRIANEELTPGVFRQIMTHVYERFPQGSCSYKEFIHEVRATMMKMKGDAFTIQLGHLLDRVAIEVLQQKKETYGVQSVDDPLPLSLWFSILTLAMKSDAPDRIRILFEVLERENQDHSSSTSSSTLVSLDQVRKMVGHLQETYQLPPDAQIVATSEKYPTQQWKQGTPEDLVPWEDGSEGDMLDIDAFASILRSKSVCAWGECYYKKEFNGVDE